MGDVGRAGARLGDVMRFEFRVHNSDQTVADAQSLILPDLDSAWSQVVDIAHGMGDIGGRIAVADETGKIIILVDVVEIISHLEAPKSAKPTVILRALTAH
jgi:hypothetical protein